MYRFGTCINIRFSVIVHTSIQLPQTLSTPLSQYGNRSTQNERNLEVILEFVRKTLDALGTYTNYQLAL